jgi:NADH dehydrogenase
VLGGGFAGAYCAQALERRTSRGEAHITLLDRQNFFIFSPLLIEAGTGSVEPRHAVVSIRSFLKRTRFRMVEVTGLDPARNEVAVLAPDGNEERIPYDHVVVALGSVTRLPPVPGLVEHGFQIKSLADAVALRDRAIQLLEIADASSDAGVRASALHFVVVGANFTGAEMAGELDALLRGAVRGYRHIRRDEIRITLIDHGPRILPALDEHLSAYADRKMRERGIQIRLRESVSEIGADFVRLSSGETLPTRTVIWAAGVAPTPAVGRMNLPLDERGYILCERDLRVRGFQNVWAIGDCAVNTDAKGHPYPATAQHGTREGKHCAANIAAVLRGHPTTPCDIVSEGSLAALGCRTGVAHVFGMDFSGFPAWWLWRTVYLLKMPGLARKIRVALDWTLQLIFPRDYVQLGVHRIGRPSRGPRAAEASDTADTRASQPLPPVQSGPPATQPSQSKPTMQPGQDVQERARPASEPSSRPAPSGTR